MKNLVLFVAGIVIIMLLLGCSSQPGSEAPLDKPYLGQVAPDLKPRIFAPGLVSTKTSMERDISFSMDLREIYFTRANDIMQINYSDGKWGLPHKVSFSSDYSEMEPYITSDNNRLYFVSDRPMTTGDDSRILRVWYTDREDDGWGRAQLFSAMEAYYPTISDRNMMYITDGDNDIYRMDLNKSDNIEPKKLSLDINTDRAEYNSYIAPDESYLIFTTYGWGDGFRGGDLWISFKAPDGTWQTPKNMGPGINTVSHEYCPSISPDGKHLFFTSNRRGTNEIFWISAEIIEHIKLNDFNLSERIFNKILESGIESGIQEYIKVKQDYANYAVYDGIILLGLCDRLILAQRDQDAITLYHKFFEMYPQTASLKQSLKLALLTGDQKTVAEFFEIMKKAPNLGLRDEDDINRLGYFFLMAGKIPQAQILFRNNIDIFPQSANAYDSYAESLLSAGDAFGAITNYKKSLELNPDNENAVRILDSLQN